MRTRCYEDPSFPVKGDAHSFSCPVNLERGERGSERENQTSARQQRGRQTRAEVKNRIQGRRESSWSHRNQSSSPGMRLHPLWLRRTLPVSPIQQQQPLEGGHTSSPIMLRSVSDRNTTEFAITNDLKGQML